jgi:hypothetical protein
MALSEELRTMLTCNHKSRKIPREINKVLKPSCSLKTMYNFNDFYIKTGSLKATGGNQQQNQVKDKTWKNLLFATLHKPQLPSQFAVLPTRKGKQ